jgi:DNA helicase IV
MAITRGWARSSVQHHQGRGGGARESALDRHRKLLAAMRNLEVDTPFGRIAFRAIDHQSTMGAYVGRTAVKDGKGIMVDWRYADGKNFLPDDDTIRKIRPPE